MKQSSKSSIRTVVSSREALALATIFSVAHASAAEAPKKAEADKKDKKNKSEEGAPLDEITVTAAQAPGYKTENLSSQKYVVPLRDVPQTVTVIPREVIDQQSATTLNEILRNVPGITMAGGENGNAGTVAGDAFIMRGFDATSSLFVDGVRDNGIQSRDSFNTETVEVFLGPTGTDVGRGNAAGYVNQSTKTPHLGNQYQGTTLYGTNDRRRQTVDLNQEIALGGEGSWLRGTAVRLNGVFQEGGVAGRDFVQRDIKGIAPSLAFGLGTDFRAIFSYSHVEQTGTIDYGIPAYRNHVAPGVKSDWFYGTEDDYDDVDQDTFTARFEYDINEDLKLTNQTRYNDTSRASVGVRPAYSFAVGPNFGKVTRTLVAGDRENEIFANQTFLTYKVATGPLKHTFVAGLEYTEETQDSYTLAGAGTFAPQPSPFEPGHETAPGFVDWTRNPYAISSGETETVSVSLFDTIEIGSKWILSGGVRMDSYDTSFNSISTTGVPTPNPATPATAGMHSFDASDEVFSGKIGLTYKPVEEGSIYVAYSRTVTPPGTGNFTLNAAGTSTADINSDPQESENIELGTKWDFFDSKLSVTAATFYTENTNFIYVEDPAGPTYSSDGGQKIIGATLGATGQITENWSVIGSLTWLNGEIDQPGNVIDGNRLSRTPDWAGTLWTAYKLPKGFTVALGFRFQDSVNTSTVNHSPTMDGYGVFDGMVQYDVNENLNFRLNIYNLLDHKYVASTSGGGGGDGGGTGGTTGGGTDASGNRVLMGAPISFALSANYKF